MLYAQIIKLFNHDTAFNLMKSYIRFTGRFRFLRGSGRKLCGKAFRRPFIGRIS